MGAPVRLLRRRLYRDDRAVVAEHPGGGEDPCAKLKRPYEEEDGEERAQRPFQARRTQEPFVEGVPTHEAGRAREGEYGDGDDGANEYPLNRGKQFGERQQQRAEEPEDEADDGE